MKKSISTNTVLPVKSDIKILYAVSLVIALLVASVSITGILCQDSIYPTDKLLNSFVPNDYVNLFAGLPLLLISLWLAWRGKLIGLLCWPGAIFYLLYVYFPYLICVPFAILFLPYLLIFSLSIYTLIGIISSIKGNAVSKQLSAVVPAKISGGILIGLGVLLILRQTGIMINALINKAIVEPQELALWIADFAIGSPAMLLGGIFLWKKKPFGYVTGAALFIVYGVLSLGLIPFLVIQASMTNTSVYPVGIVILTGMAILCLIPFYFFVRGAGNMNQQESD